MSEFANVKRMRRTRDSEEALRVAKDKLKQRDYREALCLLEQIEDAEPEAAFLTGVLYFDGLGADIDVDRGIECMRKLIAIDYLRPNEAAPKSQALYNLGLLYFRGVGLPKDDDKAEELWLKAAAMEANPRTGKPHPGSLKSQTSLGMFYSHPDHHDLEKAHFWHCKAYLNGSAESEGVLGVMYMYGIGVEEDQKRAYDRLLSASMRGNVYAMGYLTAFYYTRQMYHRVIDTGEMLAECEDVDSIARCTSCEVENVKRGVAVGCFYLALCYQYGYCSSKDMQRAKSLIQKAVHLCPTLVVDLHVKAILGTN